jgi:hypothetical protein
MRPVSDSPLYASIGNKIELRGIVVREPSDGQFDQKLYVEVKGFDGKDNFQKPEILLVSAPKRPIFEYGDDIVMTGKLKLPEDFKTDTGKVFPYVNYLRKQKVLFQFKVSSSYAQGPPVSIAAKNKGNIVAFQGKKTTF